MAFPLVVWIARSFVCGGRRRQVSWELRSLSDGVNWQRTRNVHGMKEENAVRENINHLKMTERTHTRKEREDRFIQWIENLYFSQASTYSFFPSKSTVLDRKASISPAHSHMLLLLGFSTLSIKTLLASQLDNFPFPCVGQQQQRTTITRTRLAISITSAWTWTSRNKGRIFR